MKLIIQDRHVSLKHAGVKTTLSDLREKFWVVNERLQTKTVWHACVKCQRQSSPSFLEVAAPLPLNCLKQAKAFEITGVDFAGPLYYKHPASRKKRKPTDPTSSMESPQEKIQLLSQQLKPQQLKLLQQKQRRKYKKTPKRMNRRPRKRAPSNRRKAMHAF